MLPPIKGATVKENTQFLDMVERVFESGISNAIESFLEEHKKEALAMLSKIKPNIIEFKDIKNNVCFKDNLQPYIDLANSQ